MKPCGLGYVEEVLPGFQLLVSSVGCRSRFEGNELDLPPLGNCVIGCLGSIFSLEVVFGNVDFARDTLRRNREHGDLSEFRRHELHLALVIEAFQRLFRGGLDCALPHRREG